MPLPYAAMSNVACRNEGRKPASDNLQPRGLLYPCFDCGLHSSGDELIIMRPTAKALQEMVQANQI